MNSTPIAYLPGRSARFRAGLCALSGLLPVAMSHAAATEPSVIPERGAYSARMGGNWEEAFVSGNGRMGAMLFGNPTNETLVANHCRLYLPLGSRELVPDLAQHLPELRRIIQERGYGEAMGFFLGKAREQGFPGILPTDPYHPAFFVNINQQAEGEVKDFSRTQNFQTGEVVVRWKDARGEFQRRMIVSRTDNVIAMSLTGPAAGALTCDLVFPKVANELVEPRQEITPEWVGYHNIYKRGKGGFDAGVRIVTKGGQARVEGESVKVSGADEVLLLMRVAPWKTPMAPDVSEAWTYSPNHPDFAPHRLGVYHPAPPLAESSVVPYLNTGDAAALLPKVKEGLAGVTTDYQTLLAPHAKAHGDLFNRAKLDLGGGADRKRTSEDLMAQAVAEDKLPAALVEKIYDAGRYMLICTAGELLPNLQGIWTGSWTPAWSGDFTLDTNVQAVMASACSANLPDLMEGYFRLVESFYGDWRLNAKRTYGARGFFSNVRASNNCLMLHWGDWPGVFWTGSAGWLASYFIEYAEYTSDREFLRNRCVPLLKEIALFYEDFLAGTEKDGKVQFMPSYNPETTDGTNATIEVAIARQVLTHLIQFSRMLGIEGDGIPRWEALLAKLPENPINEKGQLAEFPTGALDAGHRHHSQLYGCFQSFDPAFETSPELRNAAIASLRAKIHGSDAGGEQSSFGRMQAGISAAYLGLGEEAYGRLLVMVKKGSMYPSLITSHEPNGVILNTDANGSIPQVINTMLVFSRVGRIDLLPALPAAWPEGRIEGVRCRGNIELRSLVWSRESVRFELISAESQTIELRIPGEAVPRQVELPAGQMVTVEAKRP